MAKPTEVPINDDGTVDFIITNGPSLHQIMDVIGAPVRDWCTRTTAFYVEVPVEIGERRAKITMGIHLVPVELCRLEEENFRLRCAASIQKGIKFGKVDLAVPLVDIPEYSTRQRAGKIRMDHSLYLTLANAYSG